MQALLKVFQNRAVRLLNLLYLKAAKLAVFLFRHPLKSIVFIIKAYVTLILFSFCLMMTFSSFAHEVEANSNAGSLIITNPAQLSGGVLSNAENLFEAFLSSDNMLNVACSSSVSGANSVMLSCDMINGYNNQPRHVNQNISSSGTIAYTCPPTGFSDHTVLNGSKCNTLTGEHEPDPEPPPPTLPKINCTQLAGIGADFVSFETVNSIPSEDRPDYQCANRFETGGQDYDNYCHITGGAGWTESNIVDDDYNVVGYRYTSINGTMSGFDCDDQGNASDPDESCTAIDNGRLKQVDCPDGTTMSVDWGQFLDLQSEIAEKNILVAGQISDLSDRVDDVPTTDDIVLSLSGNQEFKDSIKGADGETCWTQQVIGGAEITCGGSSSLVSHGGQGLKGDDGQDCQAIETAQGVQITCATTTAMLAKGIDGAQGMAGNDGDSCITVDDGINVTIQCGSTMSTLEGIDESGIIAAINEQTTQLETALTYQGDVPVVSFDNSESLQAALGTPNDYEVRNYGTVIESAVNEMKQSPLFTSVDSFFEVSVSGTCPTYSASVPFMDTSVTLDQWCQPVMENIWPMIQAVILLVFSYFGFREAIL